MASIDSVKEYEKCLYILERTTACVAGTGARGDMYIKKAHDDLREAHARLPDPTRYVLPPMRGTNDDGTFGMLTGMATVVRSFGKDAKST